MAARSTIDKTRLREILAALRREMPCLREKYHVKSLGVFGPYARGEQRPRSKVNLVVEYQKLPTLVGLMELEEHLGVLLGLDVDVGPKESLKPHLKERVLGELVSV